MTPVTFGSVCSGIEAASVAWNPLGWVAAWLAEIEPGPAQLLAYHYPDVPNLGDMNLIPALLRNGVIPAPDVFTGGTPCQAFSVAGLRNSLDDTRGNLSLKFCEIANEIDIQRAATGLLPCVIKWENVPGVLSTKDNAFGCFLAGLAGEDDPLVAPGGKWTDAGCVFGPERTVAWRVLDAQYFGLAQRRRRVFVVASAREGFDPLAVLFESEGVRRDSAPSRSAGQDVTGTLNAHTDGGGFPGTDEACSGFVQPVAYGGNNQSGPIDVATARNACGSGSGRLDFETETFLVQAAPLLTFSAHAQIDEMRFDPHVTASLTCSQQQAVSYAIQASALRTNPLSGPDGVGGGDKAHALIGMAVRRLMPIECERLMGFPDGYTAIPLPGRRKDDGKTRIMADGPIYKALGNSWAIPVVRWIGRRIDAQIRCNMEAAA